MQLPKAWEEVSGGGCSLRKSGKRLQERHKATKDNFNDSSGQLRTVLNTTAKDRFKAARAGSNDSYGQLRTTQDSFKGSSGLSRTAKDRYPYIRYQV